MKESHIDRSFRAPISHLFLNLLLDYCINS